MEGIGNLKRKRSGPEEALNLPAGFRFNPTDEELVVHYLCKKAASQPFDVPIVAELDLYKFDPWDLPEKALFGEKEWYFFSPRDRKYPNGSRPNRAAGSGYWKATGTDKPIPSASRKVGVKKALVFYKGKPPKGSKTNWIMHEYRLAEPSGGKPLNTHKANNNNNNNNNSNSNNKKGSLRMDDWVLCRIYYKKVGGESQSDAFETGEGFKIMEEEAQVCINSNASNNTMPNTFASSKPYVAACSTSLDECSRDDDSTIDELDQDCERHMPMDTNIPEQQLPTTISSQNEPLHHINTTTTTTTTATNNNNDNNILNTADDLNVHNNINFTTISPPPDGDAPRLLDDTLGCQQVYSTNTLDRLESLISLIDQGFFANISSGFLNRP